MQVSSDQTSQQTDRQVFGFFFFCLFFFPKTHIKPMMASGLGRMWNCTTQPSTHSADSALNSICEFCQLPRDSDYWRKIFFFVFSFAKSSWPLCRNSSFGKLRQMVYRPSSLEQFFYERSMWRCLHSSEHHK